MIYCPWCEEPLKPVFNTELVGETVVDIWVGNEICNCLPSPVERPEEKETAIPFDVGSAEAQQGDLF